MTNRYRHPDRRTAENAESKARAQLWTTEQALRVAVSEDWDADHDITDHGTGDRYTAHVSTRAGSRRIVRADGPVVMLVRWTADDDVANLSDVADIDVYSGEQIEHMVRDGTERGRLGATSIGVVVLKAADWAHALYVSELHREMDAKASRT